MRRASAGVAGSRPALVAMPAAIEIAPTKTVGFKPAPELKKTL